MAIFALRGYNLTPQNLTIMYNFAALFSALITPSIIISRS